MSGPTPGDSIARCEICDWPLSESRDKGCVRGDCAYRPPEGSDEWYRIRARRQSLALHSAEREVLEACVEEDRLWVEYEAGWNSVGKYDSARDARIAAVRRYRALLDGKAEGRRRSVGEQRDLDRRLTALEAAQKGEQK